VQYIQANIGAINRTKASLLERISELKRAVQEKKGVRGIQCDFWLRGVYTCLDHDQVREPAINQLEDLLRQIFDGIDADQRLLDQWTRAFSAPE
jgi:hypothetical protein